MIIPATSGEHSGGCCRLHHGTGHDVGCFRSSLVFPQNPDDVLFRELFPLHRPSPLRDLTQNLSGKNPQGQVKPNLTHISAVDNALAFGYAAIRKA
jgi:hypothetical protein